MKKRTILTLLLTALTTLSTLSARSAKLNLYTGDNKDTKASLRLTSPIDTLPSVGFYPVTATLRNDGSVARTWQLETEAQDQNSYRGGSIKSNFTLTCPAGETKVYELKVPVSRLKEISYSSYYGSSHSYSIEKSRSSLSFTIGKGNKQIHDSVNSEIPNTKPNSLLSYELERKANTIDPHCNLLQNIGRITPTLLTEGNSMLTGYDRLLMSTNEWNSLSKPVKHNLKQWVSNGGSLWIFNLSSSKRTIEQLGFKSNEKPAVSPDYRGLAIDKDLGDIRLYNSGFTDFVAKDSEAFLQTVFKEQHKLAQRLDSDFSSRYQWPLQETFGVESFGTGLLIFILIIFAVIVGPINFFVFAKQGRRHRLFLTTSVISIATSLVLLAIIFLQDGIGGEGAQIVLKETNQDSKRAFVQQEQFCRTGMLLGTGFSTEDACIMEPLPLQESQWARTDRYGETTGNYTIERSEEGMQFSGDYFKSRSEHGHYLETEQVTQENFNITREGDKLYVVSTFAAPIETFYFLDKNQQAWFAEKLETGNKISAQKVDSNAYNTWLAARLDSCSAGMRKSLSKYAARTNSYVALTSQAKGVATHPSIDWKTTTILTGSLKLN